MVNKYKRNCCAVKVNITFNKEHYKWGFNVCIFSSLEVTNHQWHHSYCKDINSLDHPNSMTLQHRWCLAHSVVDSVWKTHIKKVSVKYSLLWLMGSQQPQVPVVQDGLPDLSVHAIQNKKLQIYLSDIPYRNMLICIIITEIIFHTISSNEEHFLA